MSQVLIVDDSPALRALQWRVLCRTDLPFDGLLEAGSSSDGVRRLQGSVDVGLVLLDLDLPDDGARDFVRAARGDPRWRGLPIVLVSSGRSQPDALLRLGASACWIRPFTPVEAALGLDTLVTEHSGGR